MNQNDRFVRVKTSMPKREMSIVIKTSNNLSIKIEGRDSPMLLPSDAFSKTERRGSAVFPGDMFEMNKPAIYTLAVLQKGISIFALLKRYFHLKVLKIKHTNQSKKAIAM